MATPSCGPPSHASPTHPLPNSLTCMPVRVKNPPLHHQSALRCGVSPSPWTCLDEWSRPLEFSVWRGILNATWRALHHGWGVKEDGWAVYFYHFPQSFRIFCVLHLLLSSRRGQSCQVNSFFVFSQGNIAQLDEVLECDWPQSLTSVHYELWIM